MSFLGITDVQYENLVKTFTALPAKLRHEARRTSDDVFKTSRATHWTHLNLYAQAAQTAHAVNAGTLAATLERFGDAWAAGDVSVTVTRDADAARDGVIVRVPRDLRDTVGTALRAYFESRATCTAADAASEQEHESRATCTAADEASEQEHESRATCTAADDATERSEQECDVDSDIDLDLDEDDCETLNIVGWLCSTRAGVVSSTTCRAQVHRLERSLGS